MDSNVSRRTVLGAGVAIGVAAATALRRAKARGITVDLAIGPSWPPRCRPSRRTTPRRRRSSPTA